MNKAQRYLLDNNLDDLVINQNEFPENTPENAKKWVYISDIMTKFVEQQINLNLGDVRRRCTNCVSFTSFNEDYCDDMEPVDQGFCRNGESPLFGNEGAGIDNTCMFHNYA